MKPRLVLLALLVALATPVAVGCGGGSDSGGADPTSVMPANVPLYVDAMLRPEGEAKQNIEALAEEIAGIDNLGTFIVRKLENSASEDGEELDYEQEVEPWLGEEAAMYAPEYTGDDFEGYGAAIQVSDEDEAQEFVDKQAESSDEDFKDGSYEGVDFKVQEDGTAIGVFDELLVVAEDEEIFKSMVDASEGENLAGDEDFTSAIAHAPDKSAADVFVDIGGLIEESGGNIDAETQLFLDAVGIEPEEATAVVSLVPGSGYVEIDVSTDISGDNPPSGDASELLSSLPGTSVAAFASAEFGKRFSEGIDQIDAQGIPGEVPPHKLKSALKQSGVDLESIAGSIGDVGAFVEGSSESDLGGALVLATDSAQQAKNTVSNIGLLLRSSGTPGITAVNGKASGFSVRIAELGRRPVVVVAEGSRIAIGYGLDSALTGLGEGDFTLSDIPAYEESVEDLDGTPITAFLDGPAAVRLALALGAHRDEGFREALRYLKKIDHAALGSEASGGLATVKLIVGISQ